jgi:hypothetical protein
MSYMDLPRITLLGRFFTDPSTVDNDPAHYDPDCTRPAPWQMPAGQHRFYFENVTVQAGIDPGGNLVTDGDPLIGATVGHDHTFGPARMVDLDVYQQGISGIWGMNLLIPVSPTVTLAGPVDTTFLNSYRFTRVLPTRGWANWDEYGASSFGGDSYACGVFQTVVRIPAASWPTASGSALADALRRASIADANGNIMLSFRMVLDGYQNVPSDSQFSTGRIVANIGPVSSAGEPLASLASRWMANRPLLQNTPQGRAAKQTSPWYWPDLYAAPFYFARRSAASQSIVIDLANALATQVPGGSPVELGNLTVEYASGSNQALATFQANDDLYNTLGGIVELSVTPAQWAARRTPVRIVTDAVDLGGPALWTESSPLTIVADQRSVRLTSDAGSPGLTATCNVWVGQWGEPYAPPDLQVEVVSVINGIQGATVPWSAGYKGNTPQAEGALTATISQPDAYGKAVVALTAVRDPGFRTSLLDGQLYFVVVYAGPALPDLTQAPAPQESQISCVVWSSYQANENPAWSDIVPLMAPYVRLFPYMTGLIDLSDAHSFQIFGTNPPWQPPGGPPQFVPPTPYQLPNGNSIARGAIPFYMTRPFTDPRAMPLTRDLSPNKLNTVLYFLYNLQQQIPPALPSPGGPRS